MPGLVGVFSERDVVAGEQQQFTPERLGRLTQVIYDRRQSGVLGGVLRKRPTSVDVSVTEEQSVAIYGHCIDRRTSEQYHAKEWLLRYQDEAEGLLKYLEGAFHVVVWDHVENALTIINDRLATLPLYWYSCPGLFAFAPRIKYLPLQAAEGPPNPGAVVCFLSMGHLLGPSTLVQDVNMLTAASILHVDLKSHEVTQHHYWNLRYDADQKLSKNDHLDRLGHAIQDSVRLMTSNSPSRHGLFLTGGWDSRSLLGASMALGCPPALIVTNGYTDKIPHTDTHMARGMAEDLGLEFRFCRRDPEVPPEQWLHGIQLGEIVTDLNPETFGQHLLPSDYFLPVDFMLKGDVAWGAGSPAVDEATSISKCVAYPADPNVKALLGKDYRAFTDDLYKQEIDRVLARCENDDWTDRRDYLWQMGSIARQIFGLGISDEEHIEVRRPLLSGLVLDEYTRVPRALRVNKNLYIESVKKFYPRLFARGRDHASNIADYFYYMAPFLRERTLNYLDGGRDLDGLLDITHSRGLISAFQPELSHLRSLNLRQKVFFKIRDRYSFHYHRSRLYRERPVSSVHTASSRLTFRIYLLLEYFYEQRHRRALA